MGPIPPGKGSAVLATRMIGNNPVMDPIPRPHIDSAMAGPAADGTENPPAAGTLPAAPPGLDTDPAATASVPGVPRDPPWLGRCGGWLRKNPALEWVLLFLVIQAVVDVDGFVNSYSRWATLSAMSEYRTFRIDAYQSHTIDWAQTPDGHYYSNKAPGPALLGYPLFAVMDKLATRGLTTPEARDAKRLEHRRTILHWLSFATQALPMGVLVLLLIGVLCRQGYPLWVVHATTVALLFGQTGALFMNTYFGHGFVVLAVVLLILALIRDKPVWMGIALGVAVLSDYSGMLLLPGVALALGIERRLSFRRLGFIAAGAAVPAALFAYYHWRCFGAPWILANKFQNTGFVDLAEDRRALWGIIRIVPKLEVIGELLAGKTRGLLFTQPWTLLLLGVLPLWFPWRKRSSQPGRIPRGMGYFALVTFFLAVWMNASFGQWHGGATPGPRYLSVALPALALLLPILFSGGPAFFRHLLVATVAFAVLPFFLLYSTTDILSQPGNAILPAYLRMLSGNGESLERAVFLVAGFAFVGYRAYRASVSTALAPAGER